MMKGSLITSGLLHVALLSWMLLTWGSPAPFEVTNVESLPVNIIPIEELTQIQQGDKKAPLKEKSAPIPTKRDDVVDNAENAGDNSVDLKTAPTPEKRPDSVEVAAAPEKTEKVLPKTDTVATDTTEIQKEVAEVAPAIELASKSEPKVEVKPDPQPEAKTDTPTETALADPQPDNVPVPEARPKVTETKPKEEAKAEAKPAEAKTAKTPERKKEVKKKETAKSNSSMSSDFNADEVAALLNKQDSAGGGAKRSTEQASLGGKKTTGGTKLSQSEMDALRGQIQNNWSVIPGLSNAAEVRIQVRMQLDHSGAIIGDPQVTATGGDEAARTTLAGGARRAVLKSSPFKDLPPDKYDAWNEVVVNFDPSELL